MRAIQYSLFTLLAVVTVVAVAVAALRVGDWFWCRVLFTTTLAIHLGSLLGCIYRSGRQRAFWIGFALFGWTAWLIMNLTVLRVAEHQLLARELGDLLRDYTPAASEGIVIDPNGASVAIFSFKQSVHSVFDLLFSALGGALGMCLFTSRDTASMPAQSHTPKAPPE